jgi:hypothetical protein
VTAVPTNKIFAMKRNVLFFIVAFAYCVPAMAQMDATQAKELADLKNKSKENKSTFLIYDTVFYAGNAYCLMQTRRVSDQGDEYAIKNLKGEEIIYVMEPGKIDRTLGNLSGDNYYRFTLLTVGQKMNIPSKSIGTIPEFITANNLVVNNSVDINQVNKLRLIYDEINPQQYNTTTADTAATQPVSQTDTATKEDLSKYLPVVRNRSAKLKAKDYVIRQDNKIIGFYDKRTKNDGGDKVTVFVFYLPNKEKIAEATSGGVGSVTYKVELFPSGKKHTTSTGVLNAAQDLAEYLMKYNVL